MSLIGSPLYASSLPVDCVIFSSPTDFTLYVVDSKQYWDGIVEWSTNRINWNIWDGKTILHPASQGNEYKLYVRGYNNSIITGPSAGSQRGAWHTTGSNISISGNLMTLLNWRNYIKGIPQTMGSYAFYCLFGKNDTIQSEEVINSIQDASNLVLGDKDTILATSACRSFFQHCKKLKYAPKLPAITLTERCYSSFFQRCTSLINAPKLPATTLAENCYNSTFYECASLINLPALPATTLPKACYAYMFANCTNIKLSTTQTDEYQTPYCIPMSGSGTIGTDSLLSTFDQTGGTFTGTPTINTTYYTSNQIIS